MKVVDCVRGGWGWGREDIFAEVIKFTLVVGCVVGIQESHYA